MENPRLFKRQGGLGSGYLGCFQSLCPCDRAGARPSALARSASVPGPGPRPAPLWALPAAAVWERGRQCEGAGPGQGRAPAARPSPPLASAPSLRLGAAGSALAGIPFLLPRCMVAAGAEEGEPGGARAGGESGAPARRSRLCQAEVRQRHRRSCAGLGGREREERGPLAALPFIPRAAPGLLLLPGQGCSLRDRPGSSRGGTGLGAEVAAGTGLWRR